MICKRWIRAVGIATMVLAGCSYISAALNTDAVYLKIGSVLIGEIKGMGLGRLEFNTNQMGSISIDWDKIKFITSTRNFDIELTTGERFFGSLIKAPEEGHLMIAIAGESLTVHMNKVAFLTPIETGFWDRVRASVDLGFSYTKSRKTLQWEVGVDAKYEARHFSIDLNGSSFFSNQKDIRKTSRSTLGITYLHFFRNRWYGAILSNLEQNDELGLALRTLAGGAVGRQLVRTSTSMFSGFVGIVLTLENYKGPDPSLTSVEALFSLQFLIFRFEKKDTEVTTTLSVFPSLTSWGRFRATFDGRLQIELVKDLYWGMRPYYTYDSDPPTSASSRDDYGVTTSLGWSW